jgi:hypothetical protein
MKWGLAGLLFALAVGLAIATAALRADNARCRHHVERAYRDVWDRVVEYRRLAVEQLKAASPERLSAAQWEHLRAARQRREAFLQ